MAKVRFTKEFWFRAGPSVRKRYLPSDKPQVVTREAAEQAIAAGKAVAVEDGNGARAERAKAEPKAAAADGNDAGRGSDGDGGSR